MDAPSPGPTHGCAARPAIPVRPKTVSVNGVAIPRAAIARETQNHPASKPIEAWQAAARALAVRELLLQEARRLGIAADPLDDGEGRRETEEEALIRALVEREIHTPVADEAACLRYYEQNRQRFRSPDLHEVSHILLSAAPSDAAAREAGRARAAGIIAELQRDPAAFAALAGAASACPSGSTGGMLGQIGPGQTVPEFEAALRTLPEGAVADQPVETRYGLHVVRVDRRIPGQELPFVLVRDRIAAWLAEKVRRTAIRQYIAVLAGRAEITGIAIAAAETPLVQ